MKIEKVRTMAMRTTSGENQIVIEAIVQEDVTVNTSKMIQLRGTIFANLLKHITAKQSATVIPSAVQKSHL